MAERGTAGRVGILWRGDRAARERARTDQGRLGPLFQALFAVDISAEPVVFGDDMVDEAREQLLGLDGVLVWVDPIMGGTDRTKLDALLRDVAAKGVRVSAHPDVILKMGTKEVLFATRGLGWGSDIHVYRMMVQFRSEFPERLAGGDARVLKQYRGNGGIGVWKVELVAKVSTPLDGDAFVRVQDAGPRDTVTEELPLAGFIDRCAAYFSGDGRIVDQPFMPRIVDGMIRCYMVRDEVAGFAHQSWDGSPPPLAGAGAGAAPPNVFGLPAKKTMYDASEPRFQQLKASMESDWAPGMQRLLGVSAGELPILWDADFLYGPKTAAGDDTYVLCEINVSSVFPFPEQVPPRLAEAVAAWLR
jgi:hypothetical protein